LLYVKFAFLPPLPEILAKMVKPSSTVRIGVIGLGQWGPNHVRSLRMVEGCTVARICDKSEKRLALARRLFPGVETTGDPMAVTRAPDIDAVVVATPVQTHFRLVGQALASGKDVLCEKPFTLRSSESRELCNAARKNRRILLVGHVFVYNPGTLHLKQAIDRGELGRIYYMDAVRTNLGPVRSDVGVVFDLASHDISIFNFLLGSRPQSVSAVGGAFLQRGIEDIAFLTLTYPGGVICHVHTSWLNPRKVRQLTIVGDRKMAVWDDMNTLEPIRYYDKGVEHKNYSSFGEFHMILRDGAISIPKLKLFEPLLRQNQEFVDCIRSRRAPLAGARFGGDIVFTLEAARDSVRHGGRTIRIRYP
jgi:predicted dehydrogenase